MTKTRRKTRAATEAENEGGDDSAQTLSVDVPDDVDEEVLDDLLGEHSATSVTHESIAYLYKLIVGQFAELEGLQHELEDARGDSQKKEVELDQALQDKENSATQLESANVQMQALKAERDALVKSQAELNDKINSLTSSQLSNSSVSEELKRSVEDREREKRDLIGVVSRLKEESSSRDEEVQTLRANLKSARQDHQDLEGQLRELRSKETTSQFQVDTLTQQRNLSQAEAERATTELTTKSEEFSRQRRAKHAELLALQSSYDALSQTHAAAQTSLKNLQSSYKSMEQKLHEALNAKQDLAGQLAEREVSFTTEASQLKRLVQMLEDKDAQSRAIVEKIEHDWDGVGKRAEEREAALRAETERERKGREAAEKRADQLEAVVEKMNSGELPRAGPDSGMDAMMGLSPTIAMASRVQKSGKTFTEVYADYVRLQDEFAQKCKEYDHMDRTLHAVLAQIEERAPILSQQRIEYERLQSESSQLSAQLSSALADREAQTSLAKSSSLKLDKAMKENDLLQTQLNDLGRQIQTLLREIERHNDPTLPLDTELPEGTSQVTPAEDIDGVITNQLVLFKNIGGLQEQNQKLLKITRELGRKMEQEEREYKEQLEKEQEEAVQEAHEMILELRRQMETQQRVHQSVVEGHVKEKETIKRSLERAESRAGGRMGDMDIDPTTSSGTGDTELARELVETRAQFDMYRTETGVDSNRLREESLTTSRENASLATALAKANARIDYLNERHRISEEQYAINNKEIDELNKRNQNLYDNWTRIDIEFARTHEELQISNGRLEQLRNECANLRAEKKIWESVQNRLSEDNRSLALERSRLSDLMGNVQKMHLDLERSNENDRKRMESQLALLEGQSVDIKNQLTHERDASRHNILQKEIELKDLQTKYDRMIQDLSRARETLIGVETTKRHLEERVTDLTRQLRGNEEKLAVYERRPMNSSISVPSSSQMQLDSDASTEQRLEAEVADLRSRVTVMEVDLDHARANAKQYESISQSAEAALISLQETHEQLKTSTDAEITRLESDRKALEEKLAISQQELSQRSAQLGELQKSQETERIAWLNDKKTLEDTIADLGNADKISETDRTSREVEIREQQKKARAAEERYQSEVVSHAESIKTIENLRKELSQTQASSREALTAAETAKANLATSETSWTTQRVALDQEVAELTSRCKDLASQNAILHQHLEDVSKQADRIRDAANKTPSVAEDGEAAAPDSDSRADDLRPVLAYLRKEKDIAELQLELNKQENLRLKSHVDHLTQSLDETRKSLTEERERAVQNATSGIQHDELMERINQINILRESNATLRVDSENNAKKARTLESKLRELSTQLEPAIEEARSARAELDARDLQIKDLETKNKNWQERSQQLVSKYDRIDPEDVKSLKEEIAQLKEEKTSVETTITNQTTNIQTLKQLNVNNNRIARDKIARVEKERDEVVVEKEAIVQKCSELESEIASLRTSAITSDSNVASELASLKDERDRLIAERDQLLVEKEALPSTVSQPSEPAAPISDSEREALIKARDEALANVTAESDKATKATNENARLKTLVNRLNERLKTQSAEAAETNKKAKEALEKATSGSLATASPELTQKHAEELKAQAEQLRTHHQEEMKNAVDSAIVEAKKNMPASAGDSGTIDQASLEAAVTTKMKELEAKHEQEIADAIERGRKEAAAKTKLKDQQLVKSQSKLKDLEQKVEAWKAAGHIPPDAVGTSAVPTNPAATTASKATSSSSPVTGAPSATAGATVPVRKASVAGAPLSGNTPIATGSTPGRGRGAGRGGRGGRGAGAAQKITELVGGAGRGGAPAATAAKPGADTGVSIMGAAGAKRPRDSEGDAAAGDLAKRLKPTTEGAPSTASPGTGKPVTIKRPTQS